MSMRRRLSLALLFLACVFAVKDPELEQCKHQCGHDMQYTKQQEKKKQQKEGSERQSQPYVFQEQEFNTMLKNEHGSCRLLPKFTERSKLFKGIESYRVALFEVNPQSFVLPNHWDSECLLVVTKGRGKVNLIRGYKRERFNLGLGDVLRIQAGTVVYIINSDDSEKFVSVNFLQPVFTPGEYWPFFDAAGEEPESYYKAFSTQLLEAAFNTDRKRLERIFKQQKDGLFVKASPEQIKAMSQEEEGGSIWPFGVESKYVFHLFSKRPSQTNQYRKIFEVGPREWKELQQLDVGISFANITQGSMATPFYNSKATKVAFVTKGEGYFEMACPHSTSSHSSKSSPNYRRVSSHLKSGMVYIVPAGHPIITIASQNQNLEVISFEVNSLGNKKIPLAGKRNVYSRLEREAKELSFNITAEEVDEIFQNQEDDFFKGPHQEPWEEGGAWRSEF